MPRLPFLTLNATPIGQETLQTGLQTVIAINNGATPAQQALAISDITRDLTTGKNLAGGSGPAQPVGRFGSMLGPIYVTGINASALPATVNLLTNAIMATEADLGRVDGFDQDEAEGERDEGTVIARSLLATKGDALEALEFADGLLDARPRFVEDFREESWSVGCSRAMRNDRTNAALAGAVAIGFGVVTFVGDGGARQNIGSDVEQEFEVAAVAGFAPGQMEGERQAVEVDLEVDFG